MSKLPTVLSFTAIIFSLSVVALITTVPSSGLMRGYIEVNHHPTT